MRKVKKKNAPVYEKPYPNRRHTLLTQRLTYTLAVLYLGEVRMFATEFVGENIVHLIRLEQQQG